MGLFDSITKATSTIKNAGKNSVTRPVSQNSGKGGSTSGGNLQSSRPSTAPTPKPSSGGDTSWYSSSTTTRPVSQNSGGGSSGGSSGGSGGSGSVVGNGAYVSGSSSTPQRDYYAEYEAAVRAQEQAAERRLQEQIKQAVAQVEALRPGIQQQYDKAAQQAYVQKMLSQRDMGQQLSANGLSGGMAESSMLGLENSYGENLNSLEQARQSALQGLDSDIAGIRSSGNIALAENANTHASRLQDAIWQAQQAQMASDERIAGMNADLQKALAKSGGTSQSQKPRLTYSQIMELYNSGDRSVDVLEGMEYYRPGFVSTGGTGSANLMNLKNWIDASGDRMPGVSTQDMALNLIAAALQKGQISQEEAQRLANQYNISLR